MDFAPFKNKQSGPAGGPGPVVRLENITAERNGSPIFADTDWTIRKGEHWAITGNTGSDIADLANVLARRIPVVSGRITYLPGIGGNPGSGRAQDVGVVSQETRAELIGRYAGYAQARWQSFEGDMCPAAADLLTPEHIENRLPYQLDPLGVDPAVYAARRQFATDLLGIAYLLDRKVLHLSSGEAQKLMIARALMKAPRLLILVDPYSGLDMGSRKTLGRCLDALMAEAEGPALVFATPRPEEIPSRITHLAIVSGGKLVRKMEKPEDITGVLSYTREPETPVQSPAAALPEPLRRRPTDPGGSLEAALFSVTNANVRYKDTVILKNVTWTVRAGENWALVGPNGAGKTTLLSLVLGDNPQCYANDVRVMGRRRGTGESVWEIKSHIGYLCPDLHAGYPKETSCRDVVLSGFSDSIGCYRPYSKMQQKHATAWLESLGIAHRADTPLGSLDLAEQRLALLARALVKDPSLLFLDEPCQSLAAHARRALMETLNALCRRKRPVLVIVTHHPDEIPDGVSRVLHLSGGKVDRVENRKIPGQ